jgi:hypothetical protein
VASDIEADALATAVLAGLSILEMLAGGFSETGWAEELAIHRRRGRDAIEDGRVDEAIRNIRFGRPGFSNIATDLAALAMLPGGVRVQEIVFCAVHYRAGTYTRLRLSCPKCSPDDTRNAPERRDVVAIEGEL